jgi:hypothetical protein
VRFPAHPSFGRVAIHAPSVLKSFWRGILLLAGTYVTDGGFGEIKIFRGSDYAQIGNVKLLEDVDSIRTRTPLRDQRRWAHRGPIYGYFQKLTLGAQPVRETLPFILRRASRGRPLYNYTSSITSRGRTFAQPSGLGQLVEEHAQTKVLPAFDGFLEQFPNPFEAETALHEFATNFKRYSK